MRRLVLSAVVAFAGAAVADEKGKAVKIGGLSATVPATWKAKELPAGSMRVAQFVVPKVDGDKEDAEIAVFELKGAGTVEQNLKRQLDKFENKGRDEKVEKLKISGMDATYQDLKGTFLKKAFPMAKDATPLADYRQLYVVWENKEGEQVYIWLQGPAKTVEANKKAFDELLKALK